MLPLALCRLSVRSRGAEYFLNTFTERDCTWLAALLSQYTRFQGRKLSELKQDSVEVGAPRAKLRIAEHILKNVCFQCAPSVIRAAEARRRVFRLAAGSRAPRAVILARAARELSVPFDELEAALFADLESERLLSDSVAALRPESLAQQANLLMVASLLGRALEVRIAATRHARLLVRQTRSRGLLCVVESVPGPAAGRAVPNAAPTSMALLLSGPLALSRQTRAYARSLSCLVPSLLSCSDYALTVRCVLTSRGDPITLQVPSKLPLVAQLGGVPEPESPHDRVAARFARDFSRATRKWEAIRDPEPIDTGRGWIFPSFELRHLEQPDKRWYLDIAGFWTHEYLAKQLPRRSGTAGLLLCVDVRRCCSPEGHVPTDGVLAYKGRIDARAVLALLEAPARNLARAVR